MDLAMKIAMLSCLLFAVSYADAEVACYTYTENMDNISLPQNLSIKLNCGVNTTVTKTILCDNSDEYSDIICMEIELALFEDTVVNYTCNCENATCLNPVSNFTCSTSVETTTVKAPTTTSVESTTTSVETTIAEAPTTTSVEPTTASVETTTAEAPTITSVEPTTTSVETTTVEATTTISVEPTTTSVETTTAEAPTITSVETTTTLVETNTVKATTTTPVETTTPTTTSVETTTAEVKTTTSVGTITAEATTTTSVGTITAEMTTTTSVETITTSAEAPTTTSASSTFDVTTKVSSTTESDTMQVDITMVLWIVLGCLIALIVATLGAIILVSVAHCRRYKRKKQPTVLDIISKWEDTPNESSDIQLLSMKAVEEGDGKDNSGKNGEKKVDDRVEEKKEGKVGSDEKLDKVEVKESKEDDVTVGTFGFAEKAVTELASVEAKAESPTGSEAKEGQSEKGEATKEGENEKLVEVTIEKAGEESAVDIGSSGGNSAPNNTSVTGTDTTVPTEKEKAQEGTRPEPVPVQIPIIGQQVADVKAPVVEHAADSEVKTSDTEQSNKPASPSKAQEEKSETSPSNQDNVLATESVSKEPEPAATITKPQTEAVSLASDKPPSIAPSADDATGGLSLFTNEDMEKALGVAATKDLGQVESTQL